MGKSFLTSKIKKYNFKILESLDVSTYLQLESWKQDHSLSHNLWHDGGHRAEWKRKKDFTTSKLFHVEEQFFKSLNKLLFA